MSLPKQNDAAGTSVSGGKTVDWAAVKPLAVSHEDAMDYGKVKNVWAEMMKLAGLRAPDEKLQAAFRLAVYKYAHANGTSRVGQYEGEMTLSDGTKVPAAVIPRATGAFAIRKFFRGNMTESYVALKESGVVESDERSVAKAAKFGVSAACAFATADWMSDCPMFTPAEVSAHEKAFTYAVERAKRARGGRPLESVEAGHLRAGLEAQGQLDASGGELVDF